MKAFLGIAAGLLLAVPALAGEITTETLSSKSLASSYTYNVATGQVESTGQRAGFTVYSNLPSAVWTGTSAAGTANIWGDRTLPNFTGAPGVLLSEMTVCVFNSTSGGNTLPINQMTMTVNFFDNPGGTNPPNTSTFLGGYFFNFDFVANGGALPAGFYSEITLTGLDALNINLTADMLTLQQLSNVTGGTTRTGVVMRDPVTTGSSPGYFYSSGGGGYVAFAAPNDTRGQVDYQMKVTPEPASLALIALGALFMARRR